MGKLTTLIAAAALAGMASIQSAQAESAAPLKLIEDGQPLQTTAFPKPWPMAHLVKPGTLTVGITAKTPPGSFTATNGEFDGSRVLLFKKFADDLGLKIEFVRLDWPGIMPGLAANKFDIACESANWTNERLVSKDFLLSRPIIANATIAVVRKDSGIKSWADTAGKRIGSVKGEIFLKSVEAEVKGAAGMLEMPGRPEGMLALNNGQLDVFIMDLVAARPLIASSTGGENLEIIGPAKGLSVAGVCVNKNAPDLLQAVNLLITNYRVDGSFAELERKYYGSDEHVKLLSVLGY
ncbi:MAG: transporter substrate-binding domain-containing protein [Rhizobiaceae bacterium]